MIRIDRCYDSHVHFLGTGEMKRAAIQAACPSPEEFLKKVLKIHVRKKNWFYAFGWDQNLWPDASSTLKLIDDYFPTDPVFLLRADGHAAWVNSVAATQVQFAFQGSQSSTGFVIGKDLQQFRNALPQNSVELMRSFALAAQDSFLEAGFTHLRDMSGTEIQWNLLVDLEKEDLLKVYIEQNFFIEKEADFAEVLQSCLKARSENRRHLKAVGLKLFYDGALGSEGALLSRCYCQTQNKGYQYHRDEFVREVMKTCSQHQLQLAVHIIGDEAAHRVLSLAVELKRSGFHFELHLEHLELLRDESLPLLQEINPVCHMQPSHWLSDHIWLQQKIGDLEKKAFRWNDISNLGLRLHWGSDAPVSEPSLRRTIKGLNDSARAGVKCYPAVLWHPHVHPDSNWGPEASTNFATDWSVELVKI